MPMSAAQRQKKYIEKLKRENPDKYESKRKQHLQKVKDRQKKVKSLSDEEKRKEKKNVAKTQQADLSKKQDTKQEETLKNNMELRRKNSVLEKKVSLLNKEIKTLKKKVYRYKSKVNNLQKQIEVYDDVRSLINDEQRQTNRDSELQIDNALTPQTKASSFVDEALPFTPDEEKEKIKKKLFELNLLTDSLKKVYTNADSFKTKDVLKKVIDNDITNRYKMKNKMSAKLGINRIRKREPNNNRLRVQTIHAEEIKSFFCRDDVSRITAGKQETKTKHKNKEQKRYLIDSMLNLHMKYKQEGGKLSYATFTRLKPFYVQIPNVNDRNTCACTKHSNLSFKANKLKSLRLIETDNLSELVKQIACDSSSKDCMYSTCITCKNKMIDIKINDVDKQIQWSKWVLKKHSYTKATKEGPKEMTTKKVTKEMIIGNIKQLASEFQQELNLFKKHYYNILHQYNEFKKCTENLQHDEIAILCDFSENYTCKLSEQVQSAHFGSSQNQFSLHTGVIYTKDTQPISFCTISPSTAHDPGAIWAHLNPVINYAKSICPMLRVVHIFSDGPTTQYRQKKNFFLLSKMVCESVLEYATWNFFEASHGKGPADGVGGSIKRKLDQLVAYGNDIPDSKAAYKILQAQKSKTKLFYITEEAVRTLQESIPVNLVAVTGTLNVHQIIASNEYAAVYYRNVSCFCGHEQKRGLCNCHQVKLHHLIDNKCTVTQKRQLEVNKGTSIVKRRKKSNHIQSESSESDISITYADSDFDEAASHNESTFSKDSEREHPETNDDKNISLWDNHLEDSSHKEDMRQKLKPNTSHTKANLRVSEIKILSNSTINVILDDKTGIFKLKKIPEQTAIPEQELKIKTLPKVIPISKFEQNKEEQTETNEKGQRHEMNTDKEEGGLPDDIMKKNGSRMSGSEKEQKFEVMTHKKEGRITVDIMKLNVSEIPGSEKEQRLQTETDKEERELPANIKKQQVSEIPACKKEQRLEMKTHKGEKTAPDDITKQNTSKTPGSENVKRLEMKIVEDKRRIPENECEILEPILYPSFSSELNDETTSDETCGGCTFPTSWTGSWFLSGYPGLIGVNSTHIQSKGECYETDSNDKFLVYDRSDDCYRCIVIHEKHKYVLQYKETFCSSKDSLAAICESISGDAALYSMFRKHPPPQPEPCPFHPAPFTFTYSRGSGDCSNPPSRAESCTDESRLLLRYMACPDVPGTESNMEELVCLATWKEGSTRYLVGQISQVRRNTIASDEDTYRCFIYKGQHNGKSMTYNIAQSGDATCNGLSSPTDGSRTMTLTNSDDEHNRCHFPSWIVEHHKWYSLDHTHQYHFTTKNATLKIMSEDGLPEEKRLVCHSILEQKDKKHIKLVAHVTKGCESGHICLKFYRRDGNVLELQQGTIFWEAPEDACSESGHQPYTTLISTNLAPMRCPIFGRYTILSSLADRRRRRQQATIDENGEIQPECVSGDYESVSAGCEASQDSIEFKSQCHSAAYTCYGSWQSGSAGFIVAGTSRRNHKPVTCFVYNVGGSNDTRVSKQRQSISVMSHSCDRSVIPGVGGDKAYNLTFNGTCEQSSKYNSGGSRLTPAILLTSLAMAAVR